LHNLRFQNITRIALTNCSSGIPQQFTDQNILSETLTDEWADH